MNPLDRLKPSAARTAARTSPQEPTVAAFEPVNSYSEDNGKTEKNVSVRKIDNGYLIRETIIDRTNDDYRIVKESERYSKESPTLEVKK